MERGEADRQTVDATVPNGLVGLDGGRVLPDLTAILGALGGVSRVSDPIWSRVLMGELEAEPRLLTAGSLFRFRASFLDGANPCDAECAQAVGPGTDLLVSVTHFQTYPSPVAPKGLAP